MSARWCFLGSHEIPEGERMVMPPRGGAHICVPCSQTERGQRLMADTQTTDGYRANEHAAATKWNRIHQAMQRPDYFKTRHGG